MLAPSLCKGGLSSPEKLLLLGFSRCDIPPSQGPALLVGLVWEGCSAVKSKPIRFCEFIHTQCVCYTHEFI